MLRKQNGMKGEPRAKAGNHDREVTGEHDYDCCFIASFIVTRVSNKFLLLVHTFVFSSSYFFVPLCSYASTRMMGTATRAESSH